MMYAPLHSPLSLIDKYSAYSYTLVVIPDLYSLPCTAIYIYSEATFKLLCVVTCNCCIYTQDRKSQGNDINSDDDDVNDDHDDENNDLSIESLQMVPVSGNLCDLCLLRRKGFITR